jgi:hypothetical protein
MCEHSLKWANLLNEHDSFFTQRLKCLQQFVDILLLDSSLICICVNKDKSELLKSASNVI